MQERNTKQAFHVVMLISVVVGGGSRKGGSAECKIGVSGGQGSLTKEQNTKLEHGEK